MSAVIFDLDGTLLDTLQDIANACNAALARHGFPGHPVNAYKYFVGDGVPVLISRVVPKGEHDPKMLSDLAAAYREEYQQRWSATTRLYDGIPEMLDGLAARRIPLAVLSNKPDDFTRRCVDEFLPRWSFAVVLGASSACRPKPDPAGALKVAATLQCPPSDVLYLGDTATDMKTAVSAGMVPIGALWGFRTAEELTKTGARHLLEQPRDLLSLIRHGSGLSNRASMLARGSGRVQACQRQSDAFKRSRHTSQMSIACRNEVIGSRRGTNSCAT